MIEMFPWQISKDQDILLKQTKCSVIYKVLHRFYTVAKTKGADTNLEKQRNKQGDIIINLYTYIT